MKDSISTGDFAAFDAKLAAELTRVNGFYLDQLVKIEKARKASVAPAATRRTRADSSESVDSYSSMEGTADYASLEKAYREADELRQFCLLSKTSKNYRKS